MQGGGMPGGGGGGMPGGGAPGGDGAPPPGMPHRPPGANMTGAAAFTFLREPEPVTASDGNFDHRITATEFTAAADRRFKMLDKDGDGYLTLATLPPIGGGPRPPGRPM
jgi:hypothetical protein